MCKILDTFRTLRCLEVSNLILCHLGLKALGIALILVSALCENLNSTERSLIF